MNSSCLSFSRSILALLLMLGLSAVPTIPCAAAGAISQGAAPMIIDVWPGLAPGETTASTGHDSGDHSGDVLRLTDVTRPQLLVYKLGDGKAHPAVLVLPGGGYSNLSSNLEGTEIAQWLNGLGFTAAVLYYRVPDNREGAFADARQAMALLRFRAGEFGIERSRIGVIGFSAGGHLAARLAAAERHPSRLLQDESRPNFDLLIYQAFLTTSAAQSTPDSVAEVQPHPGMPPMFLAQTYDDYYLDAPDYAAELKAAGVKTDLHMYATGGHGYGLRAPKSVPASAWPEAAAGWLEQLTGAK